MALCMERVLTASTMPAADRAVLVENMTVLARRVARNRELAGLHYRSDGVGGATLAAQVLAGLTMATSTRFDAAINAAKAEWP
jgi:hypothetical protein